jgi:NOL1/NOP2/fmu family ribosome biogenesis protein
MLNRNVTNLDSNHYRTNYLGCWRRLRSGKVELKIYQIESLIEKVITEGIKYGGTDYQLVRMNYEDWRCLRKDYLLTYFFTQLNPS